MKVGLSVVIITKDEASRIERCLRAVNQVSNDVIVVDSESVDDTVKIAKILHARTFVKPWTGYADAKNYGASKAKNDWILSIDADEVLSSSLIHEILDLELHPEFIYLVNIFTQYGKRWLRFGGVFPSFKKRLYHKSKTSWGGPKVHEHLIVKPNMKLSKLKGLVHHYSFDSVAHHRSKCEQYARMGALDQVKNNKSIPNWHRWFKPAFRFFKEYFLLLGFLDGKAGYHFAKTNAYMVRRRIEMVHELRADQGQAHGN